MKTGRLAALGYAALSLALPPVHSSGQGPLTRVRSTAAFWRGSHRSQVNTDSPRTRSGHLPAPRPTHQPTRPIQLVRKPGVGIQSLLRNIQSSIYIIRNTPPIPSFNQAPLMCAVLLYTFHNITSLKQVAGATSGLLTRAAVHSRSSVRAPPLRTEHGGCCASPAPRRARKRSYRMSCPRFYTGRAQYFRVPRRGPRGRFRGRGGAAGPSPTLPFEDHRAEAGDRVCPVTPAPPL